MLNWYLNTEFESKFRKYYILIFLRSFSKIIEMIQYIFGNKRAIVPNIFTGNSCNYFKSSSHIWIINNLENKLNFNISPMDFSNAKRSYSYFRMRRLTNTIADRLTRSLKSVIVTGDVRFVDSKPNLITFILSNCHLFVLLKINCWTVEFLSP